jgi:alpha-glucosidase
MLVNIRPSNVPRGKVFLFLFLITSILSVMLIPSVSAVTYTQIGNYVAPYQVSGNIITFPATNGTVKIELCRPDAVRVRMVKSGDSFGANENYAVAKYNWVAVSNTITDMGTYIKIATSEMVVRVQKSPISISYYETNDTNLVTQNNSSNRMAWGDDGSRAVWFDRDAGGATEHFYGLGVQGGFFDWRGQNARLWLSDQDRHIVIPFFVSTRGYGMYMHSSWDGNVDLTTSPYAINLTGGEMDYYFFYGPNLKEIITNFSELSGRLSMPPKYSLGLTYRGWQDNTAGVFLTLANEFRNRDIPCDIIGLEPKWQSGAYPCTYVWNSTNYPDPAGFVSQMTAKNYQLNLWEHPYVRSDSPIYSAILPYSSNMDVFGGKVPDFNLQQANDIYWNHHKTNILDLGVAGFKIDETDQFIDPAAQFPGGMNGKQYHNLHGFLTQKLFHDRIRSTYNKRAFMYCRGTYAGNQRYPTAGYSDTFDINQYVRENVNSGFTGAYVCPELRGDNESNEVMYQRRTQLMAFSGFELENEWQAGNVPWQRIQASEDNFRNYTKLRLSLIPYIYSYFREQNQTGIGLLRPLLLEYQNDTNTYALDNEYLFGKELLVAPVNSGSSIATRSVYLPAGEWIDYWNGYVYSGNQTIQHASTSSTLPIFVKRGAVIPMGPAMKYVGEKVVDPLTLDIYPNGTATFKLYEDDGISFDYETGKYCETNYTATRDSSTVTVSIGARYSPGGFVPAGRNYLLQVHYRSKPTGVTLGGSALAEKTTLANLQAAASGWFYDNNSNDAKKIAYVKFSDTGGAQQVVLSVGAEPAQGPTPPPPQGSGTVYEAESSANTFSGITTAANQAGCSGDKKVGNVGNGANNWFTINNINVPQSGIYTVDINYLSDGRNGYLSINNGPPILVYFESTGSCEVLGTKTLNLKLNSGANTIKFSNSTAWAPDFDSIMVSTGPTSTGSPGDHVFEAEAPVNTLSGATAIISNAQFSGGKGIGSLGNGAGNWIKFNSIFAPVAGYTPYTLYIDYSNGDTTSRTCYMSINGGTGTILYFPATGSFDIVAALQVTIYLNQGINDIRLYNDTGWGPNLDRLVIPTCSEAGEVKLTGTSFGTSDWGGGWNYTKAFDGDINSYFDGQYTTGYCGIDLGSGNAKRVTKIRYYPRALWNNRMLNGKFQGSNTSSSSGYVDLHTITTTPDYSWHEAVVTDANSYRWLRYYGGTDHCNVAEVEFYSTGSGGTPTPTPTPTPTATATPTPASYEAEASNNTFSNTVIQTSVNFSGGKAIGNVGNATDRWFQFNNVTVSTSGSYTMTVYYASGEVRPAYISVNGGAGTEYSFASTGGFTTVGTKNITVNLNAGSNTIKIYHNTAWAPDFDRIKL